VPGEGLSKAAQRAASLHAAVLAAGVPPDVSPEAESFMLVSTSSLSSY
jgi:hypothetical protein